MSDNYIMYNISLVRAKLSNQSLRKDAISLAQEDHHSERSLCKGQMGI